MSKHLWKSRIKTGLFAGLGGSCSAVKAAGMPLVLVLDLSPFGKLFCLTGGDTEL